eukprot:m.105915 g.105915  ORF g.105915 m.105915 type:complete len:116 (+) comp13290_c0_seq2:1487-1834(+)
MAEKSDRQEHRIAVWQQRNRAAKLSSMKGVGTSLVTLAVPNQSQLERFKRILIDEYGAASNIKAKATRYEQTRLMKLPADDKAQQIIINHSPCSSSSPILFTKQNKLAKLADLQP